MEAREFIEKEYMNESKKPKKVVRNDEGKVVPEHCSCGGKIGVFIQGEPIYKCTACGKYYGTMPFPKKALNEVAYSDDIVWITYGSDAFDPPRFKVPQPCNSVANKPLNGLWACPLNSRYGWEAWCREEGFKTARLNSSFTFKLKPDAKIYVIDNLDDLINISTYHYFSEWLIDVNRLLSEGYDGIYATENAIKLRDCYKTPRGTVEGLGCWDVESICIFNPNVIIPLNKENKNMKKNVIKLNEAQLRNVVRKTIAKMLSEKWNPVVQNVDSYYDTYKPVVGIYNGNMDGKSFDNAAYEYDAAYQDATDLEDLDKKLASRKANIDIAAKLGQEAHPQATPYYDSNKSFNAGSYASSGLIDTLNGFKNIDDLVSDAVNESLKRIMKEKLV